MHTWIIDTAHSEIGFKVKHLMVSTVRGQFTNFTGNIKSGDDLTKAEITFSAEIASINTNNAMRDGHLQSPDFFDAAKFPTLSFNSTKINKTDNTDYVVTGELSMHGVTKEISFDAKSNGTSTNMQKEKVMGFEISGALSRKDFGLTWNAPIEQGGVVVSDEVKLDINIECKELK
ncbi:MAG: YceI family protein [Candidatus Pacebacteria bacterium]|nr:YceI family protein [Candidatus Paceibacterota bacterium]